MGTINKKTAHLRGRLFAHTVKRCEPSNNYDYTMDRGRTLHIEAMVAEEGPTYNY